MKVFLNILYTVLMQNYVVGLINNYKLIKQCNNDIKNLISHV